jgi:protein-tyrosine phosphatase
MHWINGQIATASIIEGFPRRFFSKHEFIFLTDLNDGWNPPLAICLKMRRALEVLRNNRKVVFVCSAGINRSNALATTLLAYLESLEWDDAYVQVKKKVPRAQVNMDLRDACIQALDLFRAQTKTPQSKPKGAN